MSQMYVLLYAAQCILCKAYQIQPFPTRYAAVMSLSCLTSLWTTDAKTDGSIPPLLRACLVIYDALNDDDNEIRDVAASVVTRVFAGKYYRNNMDNVIPLVASQKLSEHLGKTYAQSQELCVEAIRRMTHCELTEPPLLHSVAGILAQARREDMTLFVQEKQNLFIDEVREAETWSRILKHLSVKAIPRELAYNFSEWVTDGISVLTKSAANQDDGSLGWTSKPEVFTLGMRVICGAEVLLNWRSRSRNVPVPGSAVRRALREFADAGSANKLHPLWLDRIEKILTESTMERLAAVKRSMNLNGVSGGVNR